MPFFSKMVLKEKKKQEKYVIFAKMVLKTILARKWHILPLFSVKP